MKYLSQLTYFFKGADQKHPKEVLVKGCEEYAELYEDDDFLEILTMDQESLKSEIKSYNEDPDEILLLIRGRLENKVIPIKKNTNPVNQFNISDLLVNLVNKKIINDVFHSKKQPRSISFAYSGFISLFTISVIVLFLAPPFSDKTDFSNNNQIIKDSFPLAVATSYFQADEKNMIRLETSIDISNDFSSTQLGYINLAGNNQLSYIEEYGEIFFEEKGTHMKLQLASLQEKSENSLTDKMRKEAILTITKNVDKPKVQKVAIKSGDNFYHLAKEYGLLTNKWSEWNNWNKLKYLGEGNTLIIKTVNNNFKTVEYQKKDGTVINYSFEKGEINSYDSQIYYSEEIILEGEIESSLARSIQKEDILINTPDMANIITYKVKNFLEKESSIDFYNIKKGSTYLIKLKVRKNKETKEVIYVDKIKNAEVRSMVIASNI